MNKSTQSTPSNSTPWPSPSCLPCGIDCGINLGHFKSDWQHVLEQARSVGVQGVIGTGVRFSDQAWYEQALAKDKTGMLLGYTLGLHPHYSQEHSVQEVQQLLQSANFAHVLAIGECGLDYFRMLSPREHQLAIFQTFVELAHQIAPKKVLFLHEREAHEDFFAVLRNSKTANPKLVHSFTGSPAALNRYLELGCYVSINGYALDSRRNQDLLKALPLIPLDRLLIETDAPYLTPRVSALKAVRTNEPRYLGYIAGFLHEQVYVHQGYSALEFMQTVQANTRALFGIAA